MDEKIGVSVPKSLLALIKQDCEDFKICNGDRPNLNAFVNLLIANYFQTFCGIEEKVRQGADDALAAVPARYRDAVYRKVLALVAREEAGDEKEESAVLSFKPTKVSERAMLCIDGIILPFQSRSSFFRRMFLSYGKKVKTEREKIIYADAYRTLCEAVTKGVRVSIKFQTGDVQHGVCVYSVSPAKEELFNYVLYFNGRNQTVRLAKISAVTLLAEKAEIPQKNVDLFTRQVQCAPQYPIYNTDGDEIKVLLTEKGKYLFDRIYLYRPVPIRTEGDIYVFNCSANQLLYYFERFGENALILSPKRLGIFMRNYYYFALKKYRKQYPQN